MQNEKPSPKKEYETNLLNKKFTICCTIFNTTILTVTNFLVLYYFFFCVHLFVSLNHN